MMTIQTLTSDVIQYKGIVYKLLKNFPVEQRKDLAQVGFVALIEALRQTKNNHVKNVGAYLKVSVIRAMRKTMEKEDAVEKLLEKAAESSKQKCVLDCCFCYLNEIDEYLPDYLDEHERMFIYIKAEGGTINDMAESSGKSVSYVNKKLASAKKKIRDANA